jgi:hypothetical protein
MLNGRVLSARAQEHDCRTLDVSPGGACLIAPQGQKLGESIVLYLDQIGRVPAIVARAGPEGGFGVTFAATAHKREKIADQLTWLLNKDRFPPDEGPQEARFSPAGVAVSLEDGKILHCEVVDFSMVGASLKTAQKPPPIGAWVRIGQTYGRVARYLPQGFAVDFQAVRAPR